MFRAMIPCVSQALRAFQVPIKVSEAEDYLRLIRSSIDYLVLFRHYFPDEYEQSMDLIRTSQATLFPLPGDAYSPHEIQFLKLIDKHLFPLPLSFLLEDACEENRSYSIPVEPFGIDLSERQEILYMDLGWQLMHYLIGELPQEFFADVLKEDCEAIFAIPVEAGRVDDEALEHLCGKKAGTIAFFRHAIDMIDHDTGTVWLDATMEVPCDVKWSRENIDELILQYEEAVEIQTKADQFINWLEHDIPTNFMEVIKLWNECVIQARVRQSLGRS